MTTFFLRQETRLARVQARGSLAGAAVAFHRGDLQAAWAATLEALQVRPFHPEAFLLLAHIAKEGTDFELAKVAVTRALVLAPRWEQARILQQTLRDKSNQKSIDWAKLPALAGIPRVSVCLIARNEERFLARALQSVRDIAFEIIVVDTGSTDRTVEIAKENGAQTFSFEWNDDFSAARNACLEHATGDWILILDADEELMPASRTVLLREIKNSSVAAYRVPIAEVESEQDGCNYVPRLFRNAPGLFFDGRIHEQIFPSLEPLRKSWGLENRLSTAKLLHHGYTAELTRTRGKISRNLRLLRLSLTDRPVDVNLLMNFGLELVRSGLLQSGLDQYRKAFDVLSGRPNGETSPELRETVLTQMSVYLLRAKQFSEIAALISKPLVQNGPLSASLHYIFGLALLQTGNFGGAARQLHECISKRNKESFTPALPEIRTEAPKHCLAFCMARANYQSAAESEFKKTFHESPLPQPTFSDHKPLYDSNILVAPCESLLRRDAEAIA